MPWSTIEKEFMRQFVTEQGSEQIDWIRCSRLIGTKTRHQCQEYYHLQLEMGKLQMFNHKWQDFENEKILQFSSSNMSWREYQQSYFKDFTISQLKNQYQILKKKQSKLSTSNHTNILCNSENVPLVTFQPTQDKSSVQVTVVKKQLSGLNSECINVGNDCNE